MAPRRTPLRCFARWYLDRLRDERLLDSCTAGSIASVCVGTTLDKENDMAFEENGAFIRNIAEVPWREFPNHFGGALSKPLVMPETANSRHLDYRISMYQPMAHVARHKHDFIFLPPGIEHAISNTGLVDLVFLVVTSPVSDE